MSIKEKNINKLIKQIAKEDVVPFFGSGFSLKAGAPGVSSLKQTIIEEGGNDFNEEIKNINNISLAVLTEKFVEFNGGSRNPLLTILKRLYEIKPTDTTDHEYLRKITHFKSLYTTNYDTFIESVYPTEEIHVVNSNESFAYDGSKMITLYKIHGDLSTLNSPDTVVITESDYKEYFKGKKFEFLWNQFKIDAGKRTLLFIGYGLEDSNIINIIKESRKLTGNSGKEWFLIAPNLDESKIKKLSRFRVSYIDAKAEEILPLILDSLKDTIDQDFKHKRVSSETYSRFCEINGDFRPQIIVGKTLNQVTQYQPIEGKNLTHNISFTAQTLLELDRAESYNSYLTFEDTNIRIPAIKFDPSKIQKFDYRVNGISVAHKNDISTLLMSPSPNKIKWKIRQRKLRFKEWIKGCYYPFEGKLNIKLQTPLCILHVIWSNTGSGRIDFEFNKTITSTKEALKWIEFLLVSTQEKNMELGDFKIKSNEIMDDLIAEFEKIKLYFQTLERLEEDFDIDFPRIEAYSEINMIKAMYALSYYSKARIHFSIDQNGYYEFPIIEKELNGSIPILKEAKLMMTRNEKLGKVNLCGKDFTFNHLVVMYNDIKVTKCEEIDPREKVYLAGIKASIGAEDILVLDDLSDLFKDKQKYIDAEEGIGLFYKAGEKKRLGI